MSQRNAQPPSQGGHPLPLSERLAYSVAEAALLTGLSEPTLRAAIRRGDLYAVRIGMEAHTGDLRIGRDELRRFLLGLSREDAYKLLMAGHVQFVKESNP